MFGVLQERIVDHLSRRTDRRRHRFRRLALIALASAGLMLGSTLGATPAAAIPRLDNGTELAFAYSYQGTLTTASCTNPARGSGYYGDLWVAASDAEGASFYLEQTGTLTDPFLQVLSDRATVQSQNDDGGYGLDAHLPSANLQSEWFLAATTFDQWATGSYILYSSVPLTRVTQCPQVITNWVADPVIYGDAVTYIATTNMNQQVSLASLTTSACTVSAPSYDSSNIGTWTITTLAAGICTVEATQAGSGQVGAAPALRSSITVMPRILTLSGLAASKAYDGSTAALPTGSPGVIGVVGTDQVSLAGNITGASYDSEHAGSRIVTVDGLLLVGGQAANYRLHNTIPGEILPASQQVSLRLPDSLTYGESANLTASASSGLAVDLSSLTPEVCVVSGDTLAAVAAGTCRVRAAQTGTTDHLPADPVEEEVEVARRTLSLTGLAASKRYDGSTDAVVSGTPVLGGVLGGDLVDLTGSITSASYDDAGAGTRTVTVGGLELTGEHAGNYRLDPGFAGQIQPSDQVVSWTDYRLVPSQSGNELPAASTDGEGALSYSVTDAGAADCSITDGRLSYTGLGTCRLRAVASATTNNLEASTEITVTVAKLGRNLGWTLESDWEFDDRGRPVPAATADGDGRVSYAVVDAGAAGCVLDGRTLTFTAAGNCILRAQIAATTDYVEASAEIAVTVVAGPPPAVRAVSVAMGLGQAAVSWPASAHNGGAGTVSYTVTAQPGGAGCQTSGTWCLITGLKSKTAYTFSVTASTPAGASAATRAAGSFSAPGTIAPGAAPTTSTGNTTATLTDRSGQPLNTVTAGETLRATVSGFAPGSLVTIYTYSTPVLLGEATADAEGAATADLEVPRTLESGRHTLAAFGFGSEGTSVRAVATYRVTVPSEVGGDDTSPVPTGPTATPSVTPSATVEPTAPAVPVPPSQAPAPAPAPAPEPPTGGGTGSGTEGHKTIGGVSYKTYDPTSAENARESASTMLTSLTLLSVLAAGAAGTSALAGAGAGAGAAGLGAAGVAASRRGRGTLKGVKVKHHKFRHEATEWGDRSVTWVSPLVGSLDRFSLGAPSRFNLWSPMIARLFGDGAYLRAMFGSWSLSLQLAGIGLGVAAATSAGLVAVPPALPLVLAIVVLSCLDAAAGFGAAIGYVATVAIGGGLDSTDAVRSVLAICLIFFAGTLAGTAARPLRRPPSSTATERYDRLADVVLATLIGAWALSAIVKATSAIAGVEFPIVEHTNLIVAVFSGVLVGRYLLESLATRYYPLRLAAVAPPKLGFPSPRQQITSAALRTTLYLFFAYVYIGFTWYLAIGVLLFFVPSVIAAYQMKLPNLPNVVRWLPKGLIKTVAMLIVGAGFAALVKFLVPDSDQFLQVAFVVLGLPGLALGLLGFFARDGETFELNWTYRLLAIPLLGLGVALATGMITLF